MAAPISAEEVAHRAASDAEYNINLGNKGENYFIEK